MKMRKILSFVLVLSLVLGSFSMAFAATPSAGLSDIDGSANEEAIQVAYDLGIVTGNPDGTFLPEKAVNRAEFAAMITRAMAIPESALAGYTATKFKDMSGYGWATGYISFCESKGIMLGDGQGNAMPGRTITVNEAMTMVLRAIGYTNNSAALVGAWPANYVTLAQNLSLYDDVAAAVTIDKANAAQIIYNVLTVDKVEVASDGTTKELTGKSLLNTGLGATADTAYRVLTGTEDSDINLKQYAGAYVKAYTKDGDIIAIGDVKSTFLTGDMINGGGKIDVDGTEYSLPNNFAVGAYTFVNGDDTLISTTTAISTTYSATKNVTIAVEKTGKTVTAVYSIAQWTVSNADVVTAADLTSLTDKELLGYDFAKDDDKNIDYNEFLLMGVKSLSDIKAGDVVYVYNNAGTDKISKVTVGTEVVKGKITEIDGTEFVINGKTYEMASNGFQSGTPVVGDTVTLKLDYAGYGFELKVDKTDADKFAVARFYQAPGIDDAKIKLYTSDDSTKTFTISDDAGTVAYGGTTTTLAGVTKSLVGYALDKDGVIETLDAKATVVTAGSVVTLESISVLNIATKTYQVVADAVVFTDDGVDLGVTTIDKVKNDKNLNAGNRMQVIFDGQKVVAMIIDKAAAGKADTDTYAVFNKLTSVINSEDDPVQRLVGFADGVAFDKLTSKSSTFLGALVKDAPALYKVEVDADGVVTTVTTKDAVNAAGASIAAINDARTAVQTGTTAAGTWVALANDVVVYEITDFTNATDFAYKVSSVASLRAAANYKIWVYETDADVNGVEFVVFTKF